MVFPMANFLSNPNDDDESAFAWNHKFCVWNSVKVHEYGYLSKMVIHIGSLLIFADKNCTPSVPPRFTL